MHYLKPLFKNLIFSLLYYSGLISLFIKFHLYKQKDIPVVILIYHRISENIKEEINDNLTINHPLNNFIREIKFLKKYFYIVTLDEVVKAIRDKSACALHAGRKGWTKPAIAITFDDGFEDNYRLAFPVLKKFNIPAAIFLTAGLIGTDSLPWPDEIGRIILYTKENKLELNSYFKRTVFNLNTLTKRRRAYSEITSRMKEMEYFDRLNLTNEISQKLSINKHNKERVLNWEEVKEMAQNNITFGVHTMTHPILTKMPVGLAKKEIEDSKNMIEENLREAVNHFAFPNGRNEDFSEELKQYCKEIGFESVLTAVYGNNPLENSDVYALKRLSPGRNMPVFAVDLLRGFLRR